jgi:uncharacterized membrane protein YqjE
MSELPGAGFLGSVRQLFSTLLETLHVRLELLGTELEQEKRRVFSALVLAALAIVCLALGLVMVSVLVLLIFLGQLPPLGRGHAGLVVRRRRGVFAGPCQAKTQRTFGPV